MPSKRFKQLPEKTKNLPADAIESLLSIIKKNCTTKFDESVDLSFQINNKQKIFGKGKCLQKLRRIFWRRYRSRKAIGKRIKR